MENSSRQSHKISINQIKNAVGENRIRIAVQGIHSAENVDTLLYGECLARFVDRCGAIRSAGEFIPALDSQRKTPLLDKHMIKLVLDELEADPLAVLGCNISADSLATGLRWSAIYNQILVRSHLAKRLVLEVTETFPLFDTAKTNKRLATARRLGCLIAIDDFGNGQITPLQLLEMEVDIVKIDAAFVWRNKNGATESNSLQHIIGIAKCAASIVVAEGVETEKHRKDVTAAGATHIQGYHLSTPVLLDTNQCSASEQGFLLECSARDGKYQIAIEHGIGSNTFKVPGPVFLHED